ncbi:hypothetical protein E3N88_41587 [Mikania micrantha]|uniref:Uncharacterized protein n=1 Tax=Mikania micrantha TaxID=192012 RepID=A0A5N6LK77_9ASTR|nr:hypothetical protein E3N88_41587 [Mikania micrantha]
MVCFDLSNVPIHHPPYSPLAPQWYRLEGGDDLNTVRKVYGDVQLFVWIGTQANDAFPESCSSDAPYVSHTRSKVYELPKLWYLIVTVMKAHDLEIAPNLAPLCMSALRHHRRSSNSGRKMAAQIAPLDMHCGNELDLHSCSKHAHMENVEHWVGGMVVQLVEQQLGYLGLEWVGDKHCGSDHTYHNSCIDDMG